MKIKWTLPTLIVCALVVVALPYVILTGNGRLLVISALIYAMLSTSWSLTLGYGGIFNFAHVAFFGLGGYGTAIVAVRLDWNPWLAVLFGGVIGALAGVVTFLPVIRMRGIYIGLITFVVVQLSSLLVLAFPNLTGGSQGMVGVPGLQIGSFALRDAGGAAYLWLFGALLVVLIFGMKLLLNSRFGLGLIALRDNEALAGSRGVNRISRQTQAFAISGAMAGVTGGLYVTYFRVADTSLFSFGFITLALSMIFVGGMKAVWGPALGALIITVLNRQLVDLGAWSQVIIGFGTVLVLIFMPNGLSGAIMALWRRLRPNSKAARRTTGSPATVGIATGR